MKEPKKAEVCIKCGAKATMWVSTRTFTAQRPKGRYLAWFCPACFKAEDEAREQWADRNSSPHLS
jgi:hypothetical protein